MRGTWQKSQESAGAIQDSTVHIIKIFTILILYKSQKSMLFIMLRKLRGDHFHEWIELKYIIIIVLSDLNLNFVIYYVYILFALISK